MVQRRPLYRLSPPLSPRAHVLCFSGKGNICINWAKDEPHRARIDNPAEEWIQDDWFMESPIREDEDF